MTHWTPRSERWLAADALAELEASLEERDRGSANS